MSTPTIRDLLRAERRREAHRLAEWLEAVRGRFLRGLTPVAALEEELDAVWNEADRIGVGVELSRLEATRRAESEGDC